MIEGDKSSRKDCFRPGGGRRARERQGRRRAGADGCDVVRCDTRQQHSVGSIEQPQPDTGEWLRLDAKRHDQRGWAPMDKKKNDGRTMAFLH